MPDRAAGAHRAALRAWWLALNRLKKNFLHSPTTWGNLAMRINLIERARLILTHLTVDASFAPLEGFAFIELMDISLYESVLRDDALPRIPKHVLLYLVFRSNDSDQCYPSQSLIGKQLRYGRQRIAEAITFLKCGKYVETCAKGRVLMYDLSGMRTRYEKNLSGFKSDLSGRRTPTCPNSGHRTRSELANERIDKNGLRYRVTVEGSRQYL